MEIVTKQDQQQELETSVSEERELFFSAFDPSRNSKKFCCSFGGRALSSFKHTRRLFWMEEYHIMSGNRLH